ncbi:MAG TPA: 3'-5' exonuclease, partial [Caulobacteraceae bacterium]|nr:3'-5' exonuclease [Caulobacteraceae bacterium]
LAERIATEIETLLARGEMVHDRDMRTWRPADPGDVLILVRKRAAMFEEVIRALKRRGIPVAGADRLNLSEHPVFEDALALMRFVQFPDDDLTLAGLLRSPFCDVDEDGLFALAWKRRGSLWTALQARSGERPAWDAALGLLQSVREEARTRTPFDLFSRLFARLDGDGRSQRTRFLTRLGPEASDAIDEFLAQVLAAEQRGERDLEQLAHALARLDVTVKREMDEPRGEVRVMTAHGAKGLEAPIVFLPETVQTGEPRGSPLLETENGGFLWCGGGKNDCAASKVARELRKRKGDDEALRLLYVALTRARDRVVLAGRARQPRKDGTDNLKGWYPLVEAAFDHAQVRPRVRTVVRNGMEIRRFGHDPAVGSGERPRPLATPSLPAWARTPAPPEPRAARWASPSEVAEQARAPSPSPLAESGGLGRFRRGELIHRLFQLLPDLPEDERPAAAHALLRREPNLADAQREEMVGSVFAVLQDARFAEVFGPGSRPEVAVAGSAPDLPAGLAISGRLDRLVVTPDRVLVVDYKTNRPAPARAEDADPSYLAQMAVYAAVLRALYPDRPVEAALLWTDGPRLTPLDEGLLQRTLAGLRG